MLNPWLNDNWKKYYNNTTIRGGVYLRFEVNVNNDVKCALKKFMKWIRNNYAFPIRLPIYVKCSEYVRTRDGDLVVGSFFEPNDYFVEPYIRMSTGDYIHLLKSYGRDDALASIIYTLSHEITHYYQWINRLNLTIFEREKQADYYGDYILHLYANYVDSP